MPQGRRRVPFSGKAKKEQMKNKRAKKKGGGHDEAGEGTSNQQFFTPGTLESESPPEASRPPLGHNLKDSLSSGRYALQFRKETAEEVQRRKKEATLPVVRLNSEDGLELDSAQFYPEGMDFPKRPSWDYGIGKEVLDAKENKYFREYLDELEGKFGSGLSHFELNLETWRQLWRVLEMSDIILAIVDIRFPSLCFPPALYDHILDDLKLGLVLVLNKVDLSPPHLVLAWKRHFQELYPKAEVVCFTSMPGYNLRGGGVLTNKGGLQVRRRKGRPKMAFEGAEALMEACQRIVNGKVDLSAWREKINEAKLQSEQHEAEEPELKLEDVPESDFSLTLGCIGTPNSGKSSLLNSLLGRKAVSVSKTPGHTKYFQTIFLLGGANKVRLCDCPGLVFPSLITKPMQVLTGSFPIAQLREPFSSLAFLAQRVDLPKILRLESDEVRNNIWSAMQMCDSWAIQRGYFTSRVSRPDSNRAANQILRMALEGKIQCCFRPSGFSLRESDLESDPEVDEIKRIQAKSDADKSTLEFHADSDQSDSEGMEADSGDSEEGSVSVANKFSLLTD